VVEVPIGNVLIVEDEKDWRDIYLRNSQPQHSGVLREAANLAEALTAIEEMAFAVAFVDIRLDKEDDENTEGLQVLERLRHTRDHTSAIMLTGHGTVGITRDALKDFDAYEALEKRAVDPQDIQALILEATDARNRVARVEEPVAPEVLRGRRTVWDWDSEMLQVTGGKGGADGLYRFLEHLTDSFLPLVAGAEEDLMKRDEESGLALGAFWSRAVGQAVVIAFGQSEPLDAALESGVLARFAGGPLGDVLHERRKGGLGGAVVASPDRPRSTFL
jgi:ActR/RegA family two-component response regulator